MARLDIARHDPDAWNPHDATAIVHAFATAGPGARCDRIARPAGIC